jgi:hypothetical protein
VLLGRRFVGTETKSKPLAQIARHTCSITRDSNELLGNTAVKEQHQVAEMTHTAHTTVMLNQRSGVLPGASGPQPLETGTYHGPLLFATIAHMLYRPHTTLR